MPAIASPNAYLVLYQGQFLSIYAVAGYLNVTSPYISCGFLFSLIYCQQVKINDTTKDEVVLRLLPQP